MLTNESSSLFLNAESITMVPIVSAEWNHNLFNTPYITVAGDGTKIASTLTSGTATAVSSGGKENFTTKSFALSPVQDGNVSQGSVKYTATSLTGNAYKIITYLKTNSETPIIANLYAEGSATQFGSAQTEVTNLGWERVVLYVGTSGKTDIISALDLTILATTISGKTTTPTVMFTLPEIYETTLFDYRNHSLFPTESPFSFFRPGESYVTTGDSTCAYPSLYRKITKDVLSDSTHHFYSPISSILRNPIALFKNPRVPILKHSLPTNTSPYKYFVSDSDSTSISAIYAESISVNKLVIKVNALATTPKLNIKINDVDISIGGSIDIELPTNSEQVSTGVLTLYWNGSAWTKNKWTSMPTYTDDGTLTTKTTINKITVTQASKSVNLPFRPNANIDASYDNANLTTDLNRMHLIEVSPRLEVDLSNFVTGFSVEKSLDSKSSTLPISGTNSNTASISLSGIPLLNGSSIVPIFSSQNNTYNTAISKMLRRGIKFYTGYRLTAYSNSLGNIASGINSYIPAGVFYSESWDEKDINSVSIQCYDISKYLQSLPAPDYVCTKKTAFDVVSDLLDLAGFTDYDFDSLYSVCNDAAQPIDIYHYSVYSKDKTLIAAINELLMPYQIAVYIDEYGIMKFLSLQSIMSPLSSTVLSISDSNIVSGGFSIQNKAKPGKISIKYTEPKIKQSLGLRNVQDDNIKNSSSFVYVTSNDILWEQQKIDSVGFQYVKDGIDKQSTTLNTNGSEQDSIFYAYNRDDNGYLIVENEIMSFEYKEYELETSVAIPPVAPETETTYEVKKEIVSIKNNLELQSEITRFIKKYGVLLRDPLTTRTRITNAVGDGDFITYTGENAFKVGDKVTITEINPKQLNVKGTITEATTTSFKVASTQTETYVSGGFASIGSQYDMKTTPTGNLTNVKRGLFGTAPSAHKRITNLASKGLSAKEIKNNTTWTEVSIVNINAEDSLYPSVNQIRIAEAEPTGELMPIEIYPTNEVDIGYHTYSVKFNLPKNTTAYAGLFFNEGNGKTFYVALSRISLFNPKTNDEYSPLRYQYIVQIEDEYRVTHWADVTGACNLILDNFPKLIKKTKDSEGKDVYGYIQDQTFNLQVAWEESDGTNGEDGTTNDKKTILHVFLNGTKVSGWQIPGTLYDPTSAPYATGWKQIGINTKTGARKNPSTDTVPAKNTKFGFITQAVPTTITDLHPEINTVINTTGTLSYLREIHATVKPLLSRSTNYFFQDPEFLNGLIQDKPLSLNSPSYVMQTTPEIKMINTYDVEYGTPAAITALHSTIQYMWNYYAGEEPGDKGNVYKKLVDSNSIAYSTLINSGHKGRIALANNSSHQVWIKKEADSVNNFSINFTMYTPEAIVPSDPELIEYIVDPGNVSDVVQMDTKWIQSKLSAWKVMKLIEQGLTGFSKDISLNIFGNPLLQVGDLVTLSYGLNGISQQKCIVSSISNSFDTGLSTSIVLNRIQE